MPSFTDILPTPTVHLVCRPFIASGVQRYAGEVINTMGWPFVTDMVEMGTLRVVPAGTAVLDHDGRSFLTEEARDWYIEQTTVAEPNDADAPGDKREPVTSGKGSKR